MTSRNEVYKMIGAAIIRDGQLDDQSSIAQGSNGTMYLRLRDQVFAIQVSEIDAISEHEDAMRQAELFMSAQPHPYDKDKYK